MGNRKGSNPSTWLDDVDVGKLTAGAALKLAATAGRHLTNWKARFSGMLVLLARLGLPKGSRFADIHHFATRVGGLSRDTVNEVLRLGRDLADRPAILDLLIRGRVGWSKIKVVERIARPETDALWAGRATSLSKNTLEGMVREILADAARKAQSAALSAPPDSAGQAVPTDTATAPAVSHPEPPAPTRAPSTGERGAPAGAAPAPPPGPAPSVLPGQSVPMLIPRTAPLLDEATSSPAGDVTDILSRAADPTVASVSAPAEGASLAAGPASSAVSADPAAVSRERPRFVIGCMLDPLDAHRVLVYAKQLTARLKRPVSPQEVVALALARYDGEPGAPVEYTEVVHRNATTGEMFVRTSWGEMPVDGADLAGKVRPGEPIDLDKETAEVRAMLAHRWSPPDGEVSTAPSTPQEGADTDNRVALAAGAPPETANPGAHATAPGRSDGRSRTSEIRPANGSGRASRALPARLRRLVLARSGGLCELRRCRELGEAYHHADTFALKRWHDPDRIALVCGPHHAAAHAGMLAGQAGPVGTWRVVEDTGAVEVIDPGREAVDRKVQDHRRMHMERDG